MKVADLMTRDPDVAKPDTLVADVARKMKEQDCGSIPVCDEDGTALGIVTDRDIVVRSIAEGQDPRSLPVKEVMTPEVVACSPDDDLARAEELMRERQIRRLLVVDGQKHLVGLLPLAKVARAADTKEAGDVIKEVSQPTHREPARK